MLRHAFVFIASEHKVIHCLYYTYGAGPDTPLVLCKYLRFQFYIKIKFLSFIHCSTKIALMKIIDRGCLFSYFSFLVLEPHLAIRPYSELCSGISPAELQEPYEMLGIKLRLVMCTVIPSPIYYCSDPTNSCLLTNIISLFILLRAAAMGLETFPLWLPFFLHSSGAF